MKTFDEILEQLGIQSSDDFYNAMKPYWGYGADAIMTYNPKNGDVEIGSIYSNDRFNINTGKILLARVNLPDKEYLKNIWHEIIYEAEMALERAQENQ
jgi:hypothetical protein